jgi:hypothetical protein
MNLQNIFMTIYFGSLVYDRFLGSAKPNDQKKLNPQVDAAGNKEKKYLESILEKYGQAGLDKFNEIRQKLSDVKGRVLSIEETALAMAQEPELIKQCTNG